MSNDINDDLSSVCEGAVLECSLGTNTSNLLVPKFHGSYSVEKYQANITDCKGEINIPSFCKCKRSPILPACTPQIVIKWIKGHPDFILDGESALLKRCIVPCIFGGIIKIIENGQ